MLFRSGPGVPAGVVVTSGFFAGWCSVYGVVVGVFALCLFLFLSAVYLCADSEGETRRWFQRRALAMQAVSFVAATATATAAHEGAPQLFAQLTSARWALPAQAVVFVLAVAVAVCLRSERYGLARLLAPLQVAVLIVGFGLAMDDHLVLPDITIDGAGAVASTMGPLIPILVVGAIIVLPSLWFLFRLFKARPKH